MSTLSALQRSQEPAPLEIAIVNNMPDQAVEATFAQYERLVRRATRGCVYRLRSYALEGVHRSDTARRAILQTHDSVEALYARGADVLIVTGAEPRTEMLTDEPYWNDFTQLVAWARSNTYGALWSCLAAHGAVLHLDGIARQRVNNKTSGVFSCTTVAEDWATEGAPASIRVPHSRYNGLNRDDLLQHGYRISSWSGAIGVDTFWRREPSLFLFTQGHPEYAADTLSREFRRDVLRFLENRSAEFPLAPTNYFSFATQMELAQIKMRMGALDRGKLIDRLNQALAVDTPSATWAKDAERLYTNWFRQILAEKELCRCEA